MRIRTTHPLQVPHPPSRRLQDERAIVADAGVAGEHLSKEDRTTKPLSLPQLFVQTICYAEHRVTFRIKHTFACLGDLLLKVHI